MNRNVSALTILYQLSDGDYHHTKSLMAALTDSDLEIDDCIQSIKEWGVDVLFAPQKGYYIPHSLDLLDKDMIQNAVPNKIMLYPLINSTNQYLLDRIEQHSSGAVCLAEYQQNGRGRRGRQWLSPFGCNLYLSYYWSFKSGMSAASGLSLIVGIVVVEMLESLGFNGIKLKWPNDIYYQNKKLAGILIETSGQVGEAAHLVIGIGINIVMPNRNKLEINQPCTSLDQIENRAPISRNQLAIQLIKKLNKTLAQYDVHGMDDLVQRWNRFDNFIEKEVKLIMGDNEVHGVMKGIDKQGAVILDTDKGLKRFIGGEISLRGF